MKSWFWCCRVSETTVPLCGGTVVVSNPAGQGGDRSMKRRPTQEPPADVFEMVRAVGLGLPDVEATTKYDGSPVLKLGGSFMAGLATHPSAEPETLVVRAGYEDRDWMIEDAPETYYLTDYYRSYPLVLVRLSRIQPDALRDLLSGSWRLTAAKVRKRGTAPVGRREA
jgi:hypothetical protein